MTRLTQLYDLLTEHGGTLSYAALAGMLQITPNAIRKLMCDATVAGFARNTMAKGRGHEGMAQLVSGAAQPVSRSGAQTYPARLSVVTAALTLCPGGLTQVNLVTLTGWGTSTVAAYLLQMVMAGDVSEADLPGRSKTYTLPTAALVAPQQPITRTQSPDRPAVNLTGELGAARKLVAGLRVKSARGLACAGNYKLSQAEELYAQLKAGGHL